LGPSTFELWFESYMCITVRPLCFLLFATGSSIVFPEPPISSAPLRARVTPAAGRPRAPAALRHPDLAPRVARSLLPPPALPSLAVPLSSTSGRRSRAAATPPRRARRRRPPLCAWPRDLSLPFLLFYQSCAATKPGRTPSPRLLCLFFLLATPESARIPRRRPPRSLHPDQIPLAFCFLTSSPNPPT
jgi:hypothetical protein